MKVKYRGHKIDVRREKSLGGEELLYYSIFRIADLYECASGFSYDESHVKVFIGYLKERIDGELADNDPWGEKAENGEEPKCQNCGENHFVFSDPIAASLA